MSVPIIDQTRLSILNLFGYILLDRGEYHVALIKDDPEAFLIVCKTQQEAEEKAYQFAYHEVDETLYVLPTPESFKELIS